jgi:hypothetical protein
MCRPKISEEITVKLLVTSGVLDLQQLAMDLQVLGSSRSHKPAGFLVQTLAIDFASLNSDQDDAEAAFSAQIVQSGLISSMTALFKLVPHLNTLRLLQLPGHKSPQSALGFFPEVSDFQRSLGRLESLMVLQFKAEPDRDCSWWLAVVLPALPPSLREMYMAAEFMEGSDLGDTFASVSPNHQTGLAVLYYMCPQKGRACDKLFNFLLSSSPHLVTVLVSHQFCSEANMQDLFGRDRTHEILNLEAYGFPGVRESRLQLQQQLHLQYVGVLCGNDFLYYLAYLPPSVLGLQMEFFIDSSALSDTARSIKLDLCWTLVSRCLQDRFWCPNLSQVDFRLLTIISSDDEFEQQLQICEEQREKLLCLLKKRTIVPAIRQDFWVLTRADEESS